MDVMKVKVIEKHLGEGQFPTFKKGTQVLMQEAGSHFLRWHACEIDGHKTYVPDVYVISGTLVQDYNPTELVQNTGDMLEVKKIVYAWLFAINDQGISGWIPAESVLSV